MSDYRHSVHHSYLRHYPLSSHQSYPKPFKSLTPSIALLDDSFLIYSTDFGEEEIDIIGRNIREFGQIVHDNGHQLIAKQESNRNFSVYLASFEDKADISTTIDVIDKLIEKKRREEEEKGKKHYSFRRIVPEMKNITKKMEELDKIRMEMEELKKGQERSLKKQMSEMEQLRIENERLRTALSNRMGQQQQLQQQLQEYVNKTEDLKRKMKEQTIIIGDYKRQLMNATKQEMNQKKLINQLQEKVAEKEKIIRNQENKLHDYVRKSDYYGRKIDEQTRKIEEYDQKLKEIAKEKKEQIGRLFNPISSIKPYFHLFLDDKTFRMIKNSTVVMDGIGNRLFKREKGDKDKCEPPLKEINSLERRKKEVFDFIEFMMINWYNIDAATDIQRNIHNWFCSNREQFLYKPSVKEKEKARKMFLDKFKLGNTIGTIHFLPIQFSDCKYSLCFAISNYRIVCWEYNYSQQKAYYDLYKKLKNRLTWTENPKFATEMEVDDKQSGTFIHTSNKDVFVENEKVVTWMKNNFKLDQQHNGYESTLFSIIPTLYNLIVNFYDTSLI